MLKDSLSFQLSSRAPLKGKKMKTLILETKERSAKRQSMTLLALILKSSNACHKNCENKNLKTKIVVPFIYPSFTLISVLIFHFYQFYFKNKILSRIANINDGY